MQRSADPLRLLNEIGAIFLQKDHLVKATLSHFSVNRILYTIPTMERTQTKDRSLVIRASMVAFALLAVVSFALARVPW